MAKLQHTPQLDAYIERIGAVKLNFRRYMIKEYKGNYYTETALIKIDSDFKITCSDERYAPTKEEVEAIKVELQNVDFPTQVEALEGAAKKFIREKKFADKDVFTFINRHTGGVKMLQQRTYLDSGEKRYIPWTQWSDGQWRAMEPEGALPFWKPKKKTSALIMIHEGAKAAQYVDWLCHSVDPEAVEARENHPWYEDLKKYEHWGMIGGALAPHRADYDEIRAEKPIGVIYVCDNDYLGKSALPKVSKHYGGSLKGVYFDEKFPSSWDLADKMPESLFKVTEGKRHYVGSSLASLMRPATYATTVIKAEGKGRAATFLRPQFAEEWSHCIQPECYIHRDWANRIYTESEFNSMVSPFSDVLNTANILKKDNSSKASILHYNPAEKSGMFTNNSGLYINTHVGTDIKPTAGDPAPFLEYLDHLVVDDNDRREMKRWISTLIAVPEVRMLYGMLLISETQGVGKTTLGEKVLAPLVGFHNVSSPSEDDIVNSQYNGWLAQKRLAIINEIYAGSSSKAYNRLKNIITDKTVSVNKKFQANYDLENMTHIFACSNTMRALQMAIEDRRWFVPKITEVAKPLSYWVGFNDWLVNQGGLGIIYQWAIDFVADNGFVMSGETAPNSMAKKEMVEESMSYGMRLVSEKLDEIKNQADGKPIYTTDSLLIEYIKHKIYDGKHHEKLEKPLTIRKLAKAKGWYIGEFKHQNRVLSGGNFGARIVSNDPALAMSINPNERVDAVLPFNLIDL